MKIPQNLNKPLNKVMPKITYSGRIPTALLTNLGLIKLDSICWRINAIIKVMMHWFELFEINEMKEAAKTPMIEPKYGINAKTK